MSQKYLFIPVMLLALGVFGRAGSAGEEGLAAHWTFDDAANPGADASGNKHDLTLTNGAKVVPAGRIGGALELDGNGARASIAFNQMPSLKGTSFTIAYWTDAMGEPNKVALANGKGGHGGWKMGSSSFDWEAWNERGQYGIHQAFADPRGNHTKSGEWHHIAFVYDDKAKTMSAYCDGVLGSSLPEPNIGDIGKADVPWFLGAREWGIEPFYKGKLDDVRVYTKALSADEVKALANPPAAAPKK